MSKPLSSFKLRALYRSLLRELPSRPLNKRSPLQLRIRKTLTAELDTDATHIHAEQFLEYVKAQRMYATLLERYNPGMNMDEEQRIKLTAKRVGMELPEEYVNATSAEELQDAERFDASMPVRKVLKE